VSGLAPRAREDSVRPRRSSGVVARPLNFTVRRTCRDCLGSSFFFAPPPVRCIGSSVPWSDAISAQGACTFGFRAYS